MSFFAQKSKIHTNSVRTLADGEWRAAALGLKLLRLPRARIAQRSWPDRVARGDSFITANASRDQVSTQVDQIMGKQS